MDVSGEDVNDHDPSLVTGRLTNNLLVHFKGTDDLIRKNRRCASLDECRGLLLYGNDDFKIKPKETDRRKQAYFAFQSEKAGYVCIHEHKERFMQQETQSAQTACKI